MPWGFDFYSRVSAEAGWLIAMQPPVCHQYKVTPPGLEPETSEPKSDVLPLHHGVICRGFYHAKHLPATQLAIPPQESCNVRVLQSTETAVKIDCLAGMRLKQGVFALSRPNGNVQRESFLILLQYNELRFVSPRFQCIDPGISGPRTDRQIRIHWRRTTT